MQTNGEPQAPRHQIARPQQNARLQSNGRRPDRSGTHITQVHDAEQEDRKSTRLNSSHVTGVRRVLFRSTAFAMAAVSEVRSEEPV